MARRNYRKKRSGRKMNRRYGRRRQAGRSSNIIHMKKKYLAKIANSEAADSKVFTISEVPEFAIACSLYDQYKITGVKVDFIPQILVNQAATQSGATDRMVVPNLTYSVDYNDSEVPGSEDELLLRNNVTTRLFNKTISVFLRPKVLEVVGATSGPQGVATRKTNPWLNTIGGQGASIPHYGLKWIVANGGATPQTTTYRVMTTYYVSFKLGK